MICISCADIYTNQTCIVKYDGIYYEYVYNTSPVIIYNGTYYYYRLDNGRGTWMVLPSSYYPYVIHLSSPRVYHWSRQTYSRYYRPHYLPQNGGYRHRH